MRQFGAADRVCQWLSFWLKISQLQPSAHCSGSRSPAKAGFTLIEVLVAMIVAAVFVSMTMQAIVTAAAFRVVATQYDEAVSWIQEDLETVVNQAAEYEIAAQPYSSRCLATLSSNGLAAGFLNDSVVGLGGTLTTIGPRALGGTFYTLTRTASYADSSDPFRLLNITYRVTAQGEDKPIATVNTEVIPHAVFRCP
ncbi:prepilin-type N-terminal cleavage/methylation domain-containing protein [Acaryochloris sp. IP29b_bin.137]|uniref:PulJ/GspJ family protein n=1 Tax=Acaryochloris sp. IP29b_bin.137 TaxID=2969217 RepID=UPI0026373D99|nr:prepilin-type N-terminal cleavage/methylation domain-containing protein [Acaryochloris sp. IP29b_bin.137]